MGVDGRLGDSWKWSAGYSHGETVQHSRVENVGSLSRIYAQAFSSDPNFYDFYRSMQAYRKVLSSEDTTMILSPQSDFMKQFGKQP